MHKTILAAVAVLLAVMVASPGQATQNDEWSFSGLDRIDIDGVSGDLVVERGDGEMFLLRLEADVRPEGAFRPSVDQDGSRLEIEEDWSGRGRSRGQVTWTLVVPASANPTIVVDTASGDLRVEDVSATFRFDSASGDVVLRDATIGSDSEFDTASGDLDLRDTRIGDDVEMSTASGDVELVGVTAGDDFEFSTASGDVTIEGSQGILRGSTASGTVRVRDTALDGPSDFSSASGDVIVQLSRAPSHDVELSSASGDVRYEAPFAADFTLVMTKREDRGDIDAPFSYTDEERFERWEHWYERKTVRQGSGSVEIRLSTASGSVEVREGS